MEVESEADKKTINRRFAVGYFACLDMVGPTAVYFKRRNNDEEMPQNHKMTNESSNASQRKKYS